MSVCARDDQVFMVARAMARHDGHDPDQPGIEVGVGHPPLRVGASAIAIGPPVQIWQLYAGLASAAIEALRGLHKE